MVRLIDRLAPPPADADWELAAESIAVKIRWFGLVVGLLIANAAGPVGDRSRAVYTLGPRRYLYGYRYLCLPTWSRFFA